MLREIAGFTLNVTCNKNCEKIQSIRKATRYNLVLKTPCQYNKHE